MLFCSLVWFGEGPQSLQRRGLVGHELAHRLHGIQHMVRRNRLQYVLSLPSVESGMANLQTLKGEDMEIVFDVVRSLARSTSNTIIELRGLASIWGEHGG